MFDPTALIPLLLSEELQISLALYVYEGIFTDSTLNCKAYIILDPIMETVKLWNMHFYVDKSQVLAGCRKSI